MKYIWAAYKKGTHFVDVEEELSASEFHDEFTETIVSNYDACWTLIAPVNGVHKPVGLALGFWPHPKSYNMVLDRLAWFPWASSRNRVEAAVKFLVTIRHEIPLIGFSDTGDVPFFEVMMRHGMVRRIGTSHTTIPGKEIRVYETRREN